MLIRVTRGRSAALRSKSNQNSTMHIRAFVTRCIVCRHLGPPSSPCLLSSAHSLLFRTATLKVDNPFPHRDSRHCTKYYINIMIETDTIEIANNTHALLLYRSLRAKYFVLFLYMRRLII